MIAADFALRNAGTLYTLAGPVPRSGRAMADLGSHEHAAVAAHNGRIVWVGADGAFDLVVKLDPGSTVVDAGGAAVLPGFVDAHTHAVFAGQRDDEIRRRLAGATYAEIAAEGGGIVSTVTATRGATAAELETGLLARFDEMLLCGTTTAEVKSGYGLETAAELRQLEAIARADAKHPIGTIATFMGAHEVPVELRGDRERYLSMLVDEMLPEVARRGLASFADVFCERGVFSVEESRRVLTVARDLGLKLRVHADELCWTGGAELAAELGARSADHLVYVSEAGRRALADSGCAATLLPSACFYLRLPRYAPARELIADGVTVALGSDVNPGAGLSPSMPFAMTVACFAQGLSLEEAICAATVNAACSLDVAHEVGSLEVGKRADLVVLRGTRLLDLLRVGIGAIGTVVKTGRVVVDGGRRVEAGAAA
ncbi:MAG: imidazolonepropionase [Vicinamibacteria bacterium]|nr:imidazolonepropionase [Vicinamibacteria bacterium]